MEQKISKTNRRIWIVGANKPCRGFSDRLERADRFPFL